MSEIYRGPDEDPTDGYDEVAAAANDDSDTHAESGVGDESLLLPIIEELDSYRSPTIGYD